MAPMPGASPESQVTGGDKGGMSGTAGSGSSVAQATLPKAIPEDIRKVVQNWRGIVQGMTGLMRGYLSPDRVCVSLGNNDSLLLVFEDDMAERYINTGDNKAELERAISERIGKEISIEMKRNETGRPVRETYPDLEKLNIEIEIEED